MASTALAVTAKLGDTAEIEQKQGIEATNDNPQMITGEQAAAEAGLTQEEQKDLLDVRRMWKEQSLPKRNLYLRRVLRAFEVLKNNPYILYNEATADYDSLAMIFQGTSNKQEIDLYQYQDNIYQMLALAFIAALSVDVSKTRYQPVDPKNEEDLLMVKKASKIQAFNERQNSIDSLQQLELLYLWCTGSYWCYTRHIIDRNRAGVTKQPIMEMQDVPVLPDRFICPQCGSIIPENQLAGYGRLACPDCGAPLSEADWHESQSIPMPVKVGVEEIPNGMTAFNIYSGLNIDCDTDALELYESLYLDLEVECGVPAVRAAYPDEYDAIQETQVGDSSTDGEYAKRIRDMVTSPSGASSMLGQNKGTYSRCWLQPEAFNILPDKNKAENLRKKFPEGVRLVSYAGNKFLQAVPERMMDHWTWCPTIKGLGLYPFGAGDAALDIQARINDAANTIHAYLDKIAFGTILADASVISPAAVEDKPLIPGNFTFVDRTDEDSGARVPLSDVLFQPEFHIDAHIYQYEPNLIQLAQVISGVQPQIFGGSDPNVQTAGGQEQALHTALGRMMLYLKRIREERAARAKNSVMCSVENMDDQMRVVMDGEVEGDWQTEIILRNELTGDFQTYPETDEGFPATYTEIQNRLMKLLTDGAKSPFIGAILQDPDTLKVVSEYILPDAITLPGDAERSRLKILIQKLWDGAPVQEIDQTTGKPVMLPSIQPNPDFDDFDMAVTLAKTSLQQNWQLQSQKPDGFNNVLAFLRLCAQMNAQNQIKQQLMLQQASQQQGAPPQQGAQPQQ